MGDGRRLQLLVKCERELVDFLICGGRVEQQRRYETRILAPKWIRMIT
jgi:hypothetical protein